MSARDCDGDGKRPLALHAENLAMNTAASLLGLLVVCVRACVVVSLREQRDQERGQPEES